MKITRILFYSLLFLHNNIFLDAGSSQFKGRHYIKNDTFFLDCQKKIDGEWRHEDIDFEICKKKSAGKMNEILQTFFNEENITNSGHTDYIYNGREEKLLNGIFHTDYFEGKYRFGMSINLNEIIPDLRVDKKNAQRTFWLLTGNKRVQEKIIEEVKRIMGVENE
jgi:hypothetical protein